MEEDIKILEEFLETAKIHTSIIPDINFEPFYKEQVQALENLLTRYKQLDSLIGEIDNKEVNDALHTLLHCALKDTEFETQKQQFQTVNAYIKQLEYKCETIFNKLIEYSKTTEKLQKETIWKSKVIEKIEELDNKGEHYIFNEKDNAVRIGKIETLQELLRKE